MDYSLCSYKAGFLSYGFSRREKIWVCTRLVQVFLSAILVLKTLLHFMCGWSAGVFPIIITNGVILVYLSLSLRLHRKRALLRQFCFWSVNGHMDFVGLVGCIITACACSLSDDLRDALCGNRWGYCDNLGFHIVWMSFLCVAFALSASLSFWIHYVDDEGSIALPADEEDSSSYKHVRGSSVAALAVAVPGTRSMDPDAVIQRAVNYINSLQVEARMGKAIDTSGESSGSDTGVPDLAAQLNAIMARIEAIEMAKDSKE